MPFVRNVMKFSQELPIYFSDPWKKEDTLTRRGVTTFSPLIPTTANYGD
jgi:hypothetical protein